METSFEISVPFTMALSTPISHGLSSHSGTLIWFLSKMFQQIHSAQQLCTGMSSYLRWAGGHSSDGNPTSLSWTSFVFWVMIDLISRRSGNPISSELLSYQLSFWIQPDSKNPVDLGPLAPLTFKGEMTVEDGAVPSVRSVVLFSSCLILDFKSLFSSFSSSTKK